MRGKFGVPSPPSQPQVVKVGRGYADLIWGVPVSDGGSRITGYIVERREMGSSSWSRCHEYNATDTNMTISGLSEREYEFRVCAVNAAGKSEYSSCTSPVKIQEIVGGESPEFIKQLVNTSLPRGKQLVLECEVSNSFSLSFFNFSSSYFKQRFSVITDSYSDFNCLISVRSPSHLTQSI